MKRAGIDEVRKETASEAPVADAEIRKRLLAALRDESWWRRGNSRVSVRAGVVSFTGTVESQEERDAARVAAESIRGVQRVVDERRMFAVTSAAV